MINVWSLVSFAASMYMYVGQLYVSDTCTYIKLSTCTLYINMFVEWFLSIFHDPLYGIQYIYFVLFGVLLIVVVHG
jgi:hypothetical protein